MRVSELRQILADLPGDDIVAGVDLEFASIPLMLKAVEHEPTSYDEDGNATSVGGTVWLKMEEL